MFDRTDVTGIITTGAFDGNDHPLFEKGADPNIIQITTVIPFGKQRRAELGKVLIQMTSDLLAAGHMVAGQGSKLIPIAQVLRILDTTSRNHAKMSADKGAGTNIIKPFVGAARSCSKILHRVGLNEMKPNIMVDGM